MPVLSNLEVDNSVNHLSIKLRGNWKWKLRTGLYSDIMESCRSYAFSRLWLPNPLLPWVLQPDYNLVLLLLYQWTQGDWRWVTHSRPAKTELMVSQKVSKTNRISSWQGRREALSKRTLLQHLLPTLHGTLPSAQKHVDVALLLHLHLTPPPMPASVVLAS